MNDEEIMDKLRKQQIFSLVGIVVLLVAFFLGMRGIKIHYARKSEQLAACLLQTTVELPTDIPYMPENEENSDLTVAVTEEATDQASDKTQASEKLININTASLDELMTLPGIGKVKAQAIIDYRNEYGEFVKPEELLNVSGIGKATYGNIKDMITVE